jgi:hypothetical protein
MLLVKRLTAISCSFVYLELDGFRNSWIHLTFFIFQGLLQSCPTPQSHLRRQLFRELWACRLQGTDCYAAPAACISMMWVVH